MKQIRVIWSSEALEDLETIYDFLAESSQQAAQNVSERILLRVRQIEDFPQSGVLHRSLKGNNREYRYLVEGNYKIIYSLIPKYAVIAAIFDTRKDPEKLQV